MYVSRLVWSGISIGGQFVAGKTTHRRSIAAILRPRALKEVGKCLHHISITMGNGFSLSNVVDEVHALPCEGRSEGVDKWFEVSRTKITGPGTANRSSMNLCNDT